MFFLFNLIQRDIHWQGKTPNSLTVTTHIALSHSPEFIFGRLKYLCRHEIAFSIFRDKILSSWFLDKFSKSGISTILSLIFSIFKTKKTDQIIKTNQTESTRIDGAFFAEL